MIPILYDGGTTTFNTNGIGALSDTISCFVTEERNGEFELEMEYPVDGIHFEDIAHSRIILAKANESQDEQAFRIYKISKPMNGRVKINAEHVSYQLSYIPSGGFTASSVSGVFAGLKNNAYESCPFTFWTDNSTAGTYTQDLPRSIRSSLGGVDGSVLDIFGGEYEWDNFTVKNHSSRGSDNGVTLRYGKNITDIKQEENIEEVYTGVCPYWFKDDVKVELSEHVLHSASASNYPYQRTVMLDMTQSFEDQPTEAQLRAAANAYMVANNIGIPKVSITVSFVALWQTEEYKDIAPLESVGLCDYVHVYFEKLGVSATAKVVKTKYNTLLDRYDSIELGDAKSTFSDTIINAIQTASEDKVTFTELETAVQRATSLITGNEGGYVRFIYNSDGLPQEILIMDTQDISTAQKVWRWNNSGFGYSSTGYNGTFTTAITQDGKIVADFITSGHMSCSLLDGGVINGQTITGGTINGATIISSGSTPTGFSKTKIQGGTLEFSGGQGSDEYSAGYFWVNYEPGETWAALTYEGGLNVEGSLTSRSLSTGTVYCDAVNGANAQNSRFAYSFPGYLDSYGTPMISSNDTHLYRVKWDDTNLRLIFLVDSTLIGYLNSSGWHWVYSGGHY